MAYMCTKADRECDGCMACCPEPEPVYCPECNAKVEYDEYLYKNRNGDVVGCSKCIHEVDPNNE